MLHTKAPLFTVLVVGSIQVCFAARGLTPLAGTVGSDGFFRRFDDSDPRNTEKIVWGRSWCHQNTQKNWLENGAITTNEYLTEDSKLNLEGKEIYIYIHGFTCSAKHPGVRAIVNAWFGRKCDNTVVEKIPENIENRVVIVVDWGLLSGVGFGQQNSYSPLLLLTLPIYKEITRNIPIVARSLAHFIEHCVDNWKAEPHHIWLVGHSMGAQIAGNAGRFWNIIRMKADPPLDKIRCIIGLDAAEPSFKDKQDQDSEPGYVLNFIEEATPDSSNETRRKKIVEDRIELITTAKCIGKVHATTVILVHTNPSKLGLSAAVGHLDFYVNLGKRNSANLPYCNEKFGVTDPISLNSCSHNLAVIYHVRSILNPIELTLDPEYYKGDASGFEKAEKKAPKFFGHYTEYNKDKNSGNLKLNPIMNSHVGDYSILVTLEGIDALELHEEALLDDVMHASNLKAGQICLKPYEELRAENS